jgi:hypothetical protein
MNEPFEIYDLNDIPSAAKRRRRKARGRLRRHQELTAEFERLPVGKVLRIPPDPAVGNWAGPLNRIFHQKWGWGRIVHTSAIGANGGLFAWWHPREEVCPTCPAEDAD